MDRSPFFLAKIALNSPGAALKQTRLPGSAFRC